MHLIEPSIPEIIEAPELAPLYNLEVSLATAVTVLVATYPEIQDLEYAARDGPLLKEIFLADALIRLADATAATISAYRRAVVTTLGQKPLYDNDPIDF